MLKCIRKDETVKPSIIAGIIIGSLFILILIIIIIIIIIKKKNE